MSSTSTTNLGLFKATPGTAETFRPSDVNSNMDKIDAAIGAPYVDFTQGTANNTTTETTVFSAPLPAANQGTTWKMEVCGIYAHSSTPTTLVIRVRLGGSSMFSFTINTPAAALTSLKWRLEIMMVCLTTGASGTWKCTGIGFATVNTTDTPFILSTTLTKDTTVGQNLDVTMQWGAANASNTASLDAGAAYRITNS